MKTLTAVIILIFSFQSLTKADDIRDFEIEGISLGDSALNYIDEKKLNKYKKNWFKNKKYSISADFELDFLKTYDGLQFVYLTNDKKFKLQGIEAIKFFKENINKCYSEFDGIVNDISKLFVNAKLQKKNTYQHSGDKKGKTIITQQNIALSNGDKIGISCYDWSKESGFWDQLRVSIRKNAYIKFLVYDAY